MCSLQIGLSKATKGTKHYEDKKVFDSLSPPYLLTTVAVIAQQQNLEPSADRLKKDVSYLASDTLDGRRTGTAGANEAARYIAGEFSKIGPERQALGALPAIVSLCGGC